MIVLDASVLIAYLDADDVHHGAADALLAAEVDDDYGASSLTLAEVLVVPARQGRLPATCAALAALEVAELAFPSDTAVKLAQLRAATGLKMPDCCVLLAVETAAARLASFDDRLTSAAAARHIETVQAPTR